MTEVFLVVIAAVILASIILNIVSTHIGVPALLAFMTLGILFSQWGILPERVESMSIAKETCSIALIFIMFYGGFGTRYESAKPVFREAVLLSTLGVVLTALLVGLFCRLALGWGWLESLLFGSVMGSTDAASVFSVLRSKRLGLKNNTAPLLEVESGSNDPAAFMLTSIVLSLMNGSADGGKVVLLIFEQLFFGAVFGVVIAKLAVYAIRRLHFPTDGLNSLFVLAVALASYALPSFVNGNGYLSAYIVGVILGNEDFDDKRSMVNFFDGITGLMQVFIFFQLGLLVKVQNLPQAILPALAIFAFMFLIARPVSVFSLLGFNRRFSRCQNALISFVGLRGASSIVFAIVAMVGAPILQNDLFNIAFIIVITSIALQGSLIPLAARKLGMVDKASDVMKTFNDYVEGGVVNFGSVKVDAESAWNGLKISELKLPKEMLIVLIIRAGERIQPRGDSVILAGDQLILMARAFADKNTYLKEKTIKPTSRRVGNRMADHPGKGLVVLVRRGEQNIIPNGDTILQAGDRIIFLTIESDNKKAIDNN